MSWLEHLHVSDNVFAFAGELLCEECGNHVQNTLVGQGADPTDGDMENFPQGPYPNGGGEADSAQFCGRGKQCLNAVEIEGRKIGCPLGNPLTSDGVRAVRDSIRSGLFSNTKYGRRLGRLLHHVWNDHTWPSETLERAPANWTSAAPPSLARAIATYRKKRTGIGAAEVSPVALCDSEGVYVLAISGPRGEQADLLHVPVDEAGEYRTAEVASLPASVALDDGVERTLRAAIEAGAWT